MSMAWLFEEKSVWYFVYVTFQILLTWKELIW